MKQHDDEIKRSRDEFERFVDTTHGVICRVLERAKLGTLDELSDVAYWRIMARMIFLEKQRSERLCMTSERVVDAEKVIPVVPTFADVCCDEFHECCWREEGEDQ